MQSRSTGRCEDATTSDARPLAITVDPRPVNTDATESKQGALRNVRFHREVSAAPSSSRLAPARRRARFLKIAAAGAAVVGFGVLSVLVRGAHAGSSGTPAASARLDISARITQEAEQSDSFFQSGSVAPSQPSAAPQASTQTS